jgi:hypothetical protein
MGFAYIRYQFLLGVLACKIDGYAQRCMSRLQAREHLSRGVELHLAGARECAGNRWLEAATKSASRSGTKADGDLHEAGRASRLSLPLRRP